MNTTDFLNIANAICPDRTLALFEGQHYTYAAVNERANRLGSALAGLGVSKGDRLGMLQVNCHQYIEAYFACAKIGAIFVPLNFRVKADELAYMLSHVGIKVLFSGRRYLKMLDEDSVELKSLQHVVVLDEAMDGRQHYDELLGSGSPEDIYGDIADDDVTILMYTAGTTGRPKGVPLSHNGFSNYILENVEPADPEVVEKNLLTVPLCHIAGIQAMLAAVYGGRTLVLMKQFEVKEWLETVQNEKITRAMLVPTMLKWIIDDPDFDRYDLSSLRVLTYGAAPMPLEVIRKAIGMLPGVMFINAFGQTETASTITMLGPEDHVLEGSQEEIDKKLLRLSLSIGKPLSDVEVKIVDETGTALHAGKVGEIAAKGLRVMSGYWEDPEKTAKTVTKDGWLLTGDQGYMDEEGYIYLAGRGDDMIIRGGENIYPEEVENVLYGHPQIDDAAVIGVDDPEWGQQPRAVVVLKPGAELTEDELTEYCRSRLASFKRPRSVVFVEALPRNAVGKVLKRELRENFGQI